MPRLGNREILEQLKALRETTKHEIEQELEAETAMRLEANKREEAKEKAARAEMLEAGVKVGRLEEADEEENKVALKRIEIVRKKLIERPLRLEDFEDLALEETLLADADAVKMPLMGRELYTSAPEFLEGVEGDVATPMALPYDPHTANPWCWAQGGGWWSSADISIYSTFWFYFYPSANRFYAVVPRVRFRGFYILRANDKWWNSKYARVVTDVRVRAYQYNWKPETVYTVLNHGDDNIDTNPRFDQDRSFYYSFLAGGGDLAWIRVNVRIYAYARGSGSYAEVNFASGVANYLQVPSCLTY